MTLTLRGYVDVPSHTVGGFDHGDVHSASGRLFVAHTANGTVEVVDGDTLKHIRSVPGCSEASGVLCTQENGALVFAAARGAGKVLVLDPLSLELRGECVVGPKPNGLAWDGGRGLLLVADVEDYRARLIDPVTGETLATRYLPGRPRWCIFDATRDRFLVNIREPACVVALAGGNAVEVERLPISARGPHGLDVDREGQRAFVACDGGAVVVLDLVSGAEVTRVPIGGEPDAIWFNPPRQRLYVAIGRPGQIDVVDCRRLVVVEQVVTEDGAHTTAFDVQRQRLFVFLPESCRVAVYDEVNDPAQLADPTAG